MALVLCKDHMHFSMWQEASQSKGVRVHQLPHQVCDGGNLHEVLKRLDQGRLKDAHHLINALILGNLHLGQKAFLVDTYVPNLCAIGQYRDHQCVVHVSPVHKVQTLDGVAQDTNAPDSGAGVVDHDADMLLPFRVGGDEDP